MKPIASKYMCPICEEEYSSEHEASVCINRHRASCGHDFMYTISPISTRDLKLVTPKGCFTYFEIEKQCKICEYTIKKLMWDKEIVDLCFTSEPNKRKRKR